MEEARHHNEPHRRPIHYREVLLSLVLSAGILVAFVELSGRAEWFVTETGLVHLVAVAFALLAAGRMFSRRLTADVEFRPLARYGVFSMAAVALTHVIEYAGLFLFEIPEASEPMLIMSLYSVAFLLLIVGHEATMERVGASSTRVRDILYAMIAVLLVLTVNIFYPAGLEFTPTLTSDLLYLCMFSLLTVLTAMVIRRTVLTFGVLKPFGGHVAIAVALVYLSSIPKVLTGLIEQVGISEWRINLDSHYLVYTGLLAFYLGFERLRHFSKGIYADLEEAEGGGAAEDDTSPTRG